MTPIIRADHLRHVYSAGTPFEKVAIDDIDLAIPAGQFVGIIGHTGSGKSTFIQHLNGLLAPTSGTVLFDGEDIHRSKAATRDVRFQVGLVFQYPEHQLFEETVYQDIAFGPKNARLSTEEVDARVREAARFAGVDEAGRGPLCGPVCVAACILDPENPVYGINDSKKLTEKKREALFDEICEKALAYRIVFVGPEVIDRENILQATMGGMQQAVEELDIVPNLVLVDGNRTPAGLQIPAQPVVKGDATSASIGAASVLAKVSRDRYMLELDKQYPQYQLAKHKGYPTKLHYELIAQYGIQPFYRRSFLKKQGYWPESGK